MLKFLDRYLLDRKLQIPPKHQFIKTSSKKIWIYLKQYYLDVGKSIRLKAFTQKMKRNNYLITCNYPIKE